MSDNPWVYVGLFILAALAFILLVSVLISVLVTMFGVRHAERMMDRYQKEVLSRLPCTDCGKCGFASCAHYADAVLHMDADGSECPDGAEALPEQLDAIRKRLQDELTDPAPLKRSKRFGGRPND